MSKITMFGAKACQQTVEAAKVLNQTGVYYEYLDICEDLDFLKRFMQLRDTRAEFDEIRQNGDIGIPCIIVDEEQIFFSAESFKNPN